MLVIGVDIGVSGALATVRGDRLLRLVDMPTVDMGGDARVRRIIDPAGLARAVKDIARPFPDEAVAVVEAQHARPDDAASHAFSLGDSYGVMRGVFGALGVTMHMVQPAVWKSHFGLKAEKGKKIDKRQSLVRAATLFPDHADKFTRVTVDHNRAEAALIALYGWGKFA